MTPLTRSLTGITVGVSISESDDGSGRGIIPAQMDRVVTKVVGALLGQGAGIVFGHDWRKDGVMEIVHSLARQMQPPAPSPLARDRETNRPLLQNLLPWPDEPQLDENERAQLASSVRIEMAGLPRELGPYAGAALGAPKNSSLYRYLRARGLTHLRRQLNDRSVARICLGGRSSGSAGRYPGIVEEALLAVQNSTPLYLAGLLGGATRQIIDAVHGNPLPDSFCSPTGLEEIYRNPPPEIDDNNPASRIDREIFRQDVWQEFASTGIKGLSQINGLSEEDNSELFDTPSLDRAIDLMLAGLGSISRRNRS